MAAQQALSPPAALLTAQSAALAQKDPPARPSKRTCRPCLTAPRKGSRLCRARAPRPAGPAGRRWMRVSGRRLQQQEPAVLFKHSVAVQLATSCHPPPPVLTGRRRQGHSRQRQRCLVALVIQGGHVAAHIGDAHLQRLLVVPLHGCPDLGGQRLQHHLQRAHRRPGPWLVGRAGASEPSASQPHSPLALEEDARKRSGSASARCSGMVMKRCEKSTSSCLATGSNASVDMSGVASLQRQASGRQT